MKIKKYLAMQVITALFLLPILAAPRADVYNQLIVLDSEQQSVANLQLPTIKGEARDLYHYRGQVVLLAFFATWCPQCNSELPELVNIQKKYQAKGLTVVAVSIDQAKREQVLDWVNDKQLNYPVVHDQNFSVRESHDVKLIPTILVLDRNMKPVARVVGEIDWQSGKASRLIDKMLAAKSNYIAPRRLAPVKTYQSNCPFSCREEPRNRGAIILCIRQRFNFAQTLEATLTQACIFSGARRLPFYFLCSQASGDRGRGAHNHAARLADEAGFDERTGRNDGFGAYYGFIHQYRLDADQRILADCASVQYCAVTDMAEWLQGAVFVGKGMQHTVVLNITVMGNMNTAKVTAEYSTGTDITVLFYDDVTDYLGAGVNETVGLNNRYQILDGINWHVLLQT